MASILPSSVEEGLEACLRAQRAGADLVEFRLDRIRDPKEVVELVRRASAPLLIACRVPEDGGSFRGSPELRRQLLLAAAQAGAEWVDLEEWESLSLPPGLRTRVLRSYHRLQEAPRELSSIVQRMARSSPDAIKVTVAGYDAAAMLDVLELYRLQLRVPMIAFLSGRAARASRFLACLEGAPFLYCAPGPGQGVAPGQPDLHEAEQLYHAKAIGPETRFWGLCGSPVDHSLGYALHNGLGRFMRDVPLYLPFDTRQPERLIEGLRSFGARFIGLSITAPHKARVLSLCDELGADAADCDAVNTLVHRDGRLLGRNTDIEGVLRAIARAYPDARIPRGRRALVLGGGGAARAACLALLKCGAELAIACRTRSSIRAFAEERGIQVFPIGSRTMERVKPQILVHATPVGMGNDATDACLVERAQIPAHCVVLDLVYRPEKTELLRRAEAAGATPVSGLWMFLYQARAQIEHMLGASHELPKLEDLSRLLGPVGRTLRAEARRAAKRGGA